MDRNEINRMFERLLAEPDSGAGARDAGTRAALFAALTRSADGGGLGADTAALLAAWRDGALDAQTELRLMAALARNSEDLYEVESADAYLEALGAQREAAPADLVAASVAAALYETAKPVPTRRPFAFSRRQWGFAGSAAAAVLALFLVNDQLNNPAENFAPQPAAPSGPVALSTDSGPLAEVENPYATMAPPEARDRAVEQQSATAQARAPEPEVAAAPMAPPPIANAAPLADASRQAGNYPNEEVLITGSLIQGSGAVGVPVTQLGRANYAEAPGALQSQAANTERYPDARANPVKSVTAEPVSTFSVDVDTASYSNLRRYLSGGSMPPANAVRVEEMVNYFDYSYPVPRDRAQPFAPTIAVYPTPWNPDTQILHIGVKGFDIPRGERPRSNLVFLIDTSGSMAEDNKLPLLKRSFRLLVDQLGAEDTVSIVVYAGSAGTVLEPTRGSDKARILAALDRLESGGSTAGGAGIREAYRLARESFQNGSTNRVILATDGDFNVGITDPNALEDYVARERSSGVFLTVLGFGGGNYNDLLMQKLAQAGNGTAAYIDTMNEARKVFVDQLSGTLFTIAKDVKMQVEFNPRRVAEYRLIGYETRMLAREDFNNDAVDAGDIGSGHTVTALYEITPVGGRTQSVDPLRYAQPPAFRAAQGEYAFLKIRYKLPDEDVSRLIERAITPADVENDFNRLPEDIRFAAAVAGAGQLIRNDPYVRNFRYERAIAMANEARGDDEFGYRGEFVGLLRRAQELVPGRR